MSTYILLNVSAKYVCFLVCGCMLLTSCKLFYPNQMFKQKAYRYLDTSPPVMVQQYLVQPGDEITLQIFSRDGLDLVDIVGRKNVSSLSEGKSVEYVVDQSGIVDLPVLGKYKVTGYAEQTLKEELEKEYASLFNNPYVVLNVTNRRVFLFKGSEASVIPLNKTPTNLLEVIAKGGGLSRDLKAYNIKIIRGDLSSPEVIQVNLSTIEGLQQANLIVQANDVIYIEQRHRVAADFLREITPVLSILTTGITTYLLIQNLRR